MFTSIIDHVNAAIDGLMALRETEEWTELKNAAMNGLAQALRDLTTDAEDVTGTIE